MEVVFCSRFPRLSWCVDRRTRSNVERRLSLPFEDEREVVGGSGRGKERGGGGAVGVGQEASSSAGLNAGLGIRRFSCGETSDARMGASTAAALGSRRRRWVFPFPIFTDAFEEKDSEPVDDKKDDDDEGEEEGGRVSGLVGHDGGMVVVGYACRFLALVCSGGARGGGVGEGEATCFRPLWEDGCGRPACTVSSPRWSRPSSFAICFCPRPARPLLLPHGREGTSIDRGAGAATGCKYGEIDAHDSTVGGQLYTAVLALAHRVNGAYGWESVVGGGFPFQGGTEETHVYGSVWCGDGRFLAAERGSRAREDFFFLGGFPRGISCWVVASSLPYVATSPS